jgi:antibiotic biosynthesis monooxygenase (ABM) superfamily enzyme
MSRVPGFEGAHILVPSPNQGTFRTVLARFRDAESLQAWETSAERDNLVAQADAFSTPHYQMASGLESWFALPDCGPKAPPRWKMCALMFPASYVVSTAAVVLLRGLMPDASLYVVNIPVSLVITLALTYGALPALTHQFRAWLYR